MQYKIIVDKQSRTNPSAEKKEYIIDIEELRYKGNVYDSLVITKDEDYVMRRLELTEYHVLNVLAQPIKQPIENLNIELFKGDNYIYLIDMTGNRFYAEYIIKNEFTDIYITKAEFNSSIKQTEKQIELSVNEKLIGYSTTEEMNAAIKLESDNITSAVSRQFENVDKSITTTNSRITQTAESITSEVSKKVGNDEVISKINQSAESIGIEANRINLTANDILNLIAGNEINLTSKNIKISSNNFNVDKDGNVTCINANIKGTIQSTNGVFTGGKIELIGGTTTDPKFLINDDNYKLKALPNTLHIADNNNYNKQVLAYVDNIGGGITIGGKSINDITIRAGETTEICCYGEIKGTKLTNMSLESLKKNIEIFENAYDILKNSNIYMYNLKTEKDTEKKHVGFVIGENYNTPREVLSNTGDSIDVYSMVSILWQAVKEQQIEIEKLKEGNK